MPDLRRRMERILRDYGHNIYLQRRLTDETARYENRYERHTVRNMIPSSVGLARAAQEVMEGRIVDVDVVYYFQWDAKPLEGDRIHEGMASSDPRGHLVFDIDYSYPHRGNGGRIEYWACGATKTSEIGEER